MLIPEYEIRILPKGECRQLTDATIPPSVIADMKSYYEARANEYDEWFYRKGRYNHGDEVNARWAIEAAMVSEQLTVFKMKGHLLEVAPGTGIWTEQLLRVADSITAVDASPQMIAINQNKVRNTKVQYIEADLFQWQPDKQYDGVFFGFWLSHVPTDRLKSFLQMVASALKPDGKIFFVDSRPEPTMSAREHKLPAPGSQIMKRVLNDGRSYDIIKNFYEPKALEMQFKNAGLQITVDETPNYFIYGKGYRKLTQPA